MPKPRKLTQAQKHAFALRYLKLWCDEYAKLIDEDEFLETCARSEKDTSMCSEIETIIGDCIEVNTARYNIGQLAAKLAKKQLKTLAKQLEEGD